MIPETILSTYVKRLGEMNAASCIVLSNALTAVNQVFSSNSIDGELSPTNLSVRYVTADEFHDLLGGDTSAYFEPKTLYIVSSDQLNAYNERILSVANPEEMADAANKEYVDNGLSTKRGSDDLSYGAGDWFVIGPKSFRLVKQASPNNYWLAVVDDVEWGLLHYGSGSISDWTFGPASDNSTIASAEDATSLTFTLKSGTYALVRDNRLALHSDLMLKADISQIDPRYTHIAFADGTTSSFNVSGTLDRTWMQSVGIYGESSWIKQVASISVGTNVSSIGSRAFGNSSALSSIYIPNSVSQIGQLAFYNCIKISALHIPNSITSINDDSFGSTAKLTSIVFENRLSSEIPVGAAWGADYAVVTTLNNASQEWVKGKSYLSAIPGTYKTYSETVFSLSNDGYATTTQLSTTLSGKADLSDLRYDLVTPGKWEFSDGEMVIYGVSGPVENNGTWYYTSGVHMSNVFTSESEAVSALTLTFTDPSEPSDTFTVTRASLPDHLFDRANNLIDATTGNVTLTLPQFVTGKMRNLFVRLEFGTIVEGASVPTVTFQGQGNEAPGETYAISFVTDSSVFPVPDSGGDWWYSLTECAPHVFAISLKKLQSVTQPTQAQSNS